ncbi:MAG: hypothetical protein JO097_18490 [Acidobacteriaceae bacterium]|nr:hypothetical protein [Acidobacteriaceae bacterium]MBV9295100.1 hypothetical protein [Acidobacteriaceae bacterium]MBV9765390.1 hypothetical protein [Acidobacteriaceae bacterium]
MATSAAGRATVMISFYRVHLNPYLNFHRPCGVSEITTDKKGKQRRYTGARPRRWELLQRVPQFRGYLKPGTQPAELERQANRLSDTEAVRPMQETKRKLRGENWWLTVSHGHYWWRRIHSIN